jgi:cyclophilin family peptidyl-prolyl cis-trans isomerase
MLNALKLWRVKNFMMALFFIALLTVSWHKLAILQALAWGGSKLPDLKAEFSDEPHIRGALSMARAASPNSANSQFFIVTKDSRFLDNQYTVFGRVVKGMEFVDMIKKGDGRNGEVSKPADAMLKVRVAADVEELKHP